MISPARRASMATVALSASPTATATNTAPTCSSRSIAARRPASRWRMSTATSALAVFAEASANAGPSPTCANGLESSSPSRTPGHQRKPPRYSTAMPRPVAGQKAPAGPVSRRASPPLAKA